jgi:acetylornithine deacetylase/succinyl-diaminopimelate desuccinylase-like protein
MTVTEPTGITEMVRYVDDVWEHSIVPTLCEYIAIPNVSVMFDENWKTNGHMDRAVQLVRTWCAARTIAGMTVEVHELPGLTPVILVDVPAFNGGSNDDPVLLYGHLDKQPEMTGWRDDLGPWKPVLEGNRLYGRGGADDGYAAFGSLLAIEAAQREGWRHQRCVVLIEASEESGSPHLPAHLDALRDRIGTPSLVICLDAGCLDDQRLWVTTSLRGLADGVLRVDVLREGVHSGEASGLVPSSFRILRQLLDRVEDSATGEVLVPELHVEIPTDRRAQAHATAAEFPIEANFPWAGGTRPMSDDATEQRLAVTWQPTLSVTGADGWPPVDRAGNVLRPHTALRLSFRLPPTCDHHAAMAAISARLTADPPSGATVTFGDGTSGPGWNAPSFAPWLDAALDDTSRHVYGNSFRAFGEGGSIPFMGMLGDMYPDAQFVITGVLGPGSNAHGPNEFLDVANARKITASIAMLLRAHAAR